MTIRHHKGPRLFIDNLGLLRQSDLPHPFTLPEHTTHYLADVLRVQPGDSLELCDARTRTVCYATVTTVSSVVVVTIDEVAPALIDGGPAIHLFFALCKGERNDAVGDWATELGCHGIHFWQASRSIVKLKDAADSARKQERFQKILLAAAQQSKRSSLPTLSVSPSLKSALELFTGLTPQSSTQHMGIFGSLAPDAPRLTSLITQLRAAQTISIVIGPEGDFTEDEVMLLKAAGLTPFSLGAQTLRSEVAALTSIVAVQQLYSMT